MFILQAKSLCCDHGFIIRKQPEVFNNAVFKSVRLMVEWIPWPDSYRDPSHPLLRIIFAIPATMPKATPATGQTIQVRCHSMVRKLQAR